jgi:hypothetical protein
MHDKHCPAIDGSVDSPNMTKNQRVYVEVLSILTKTAMQVAMRKGQFYVEQPDGLNRMLSQINKDKKSFDKLTAEERVQYASQYRYDKITDQRLGNAGIILQQLICDALADKEIQKMRNDFLQEVKLIASKIVSESELTESNKETENNLAIV